MKTEGREVEKLLDKVVEALERQANATERMLELATRESEAQMEPGLPVCPHCGFGNPTVTQIAAGGDGPLSDFILAGETHCCNKTLYAVPFGMDTFVYAEMAQLWVTERKGGNDRT